MRIAIPVTCTLAGLLAAQQPHPSLPDRTLALPGAGTTGPHAGPALQASVARGTGFVPNLGQWDRQAAFRIHRPGATAWLEPRGLLLDLYRVRETMAEAPAEQGMLPARQCAGIDQAELLLTPVGARALTAEAEAPATATANFYLGPDPSRWRTAVPTFAAVRAAELWPSVDAVFRTHRQGVLEYDLEFAAGTDPSAAVLRSHGATAMALQADGSLRLDTPAGPVSQAAPLAWYLAPDGSRLPVAARVELLGGDTFRFAVAEARADLRLVIDPVIYFSPGGAADEPCHGVAPGQAGRIVVAGHTSSSGITGRDILVGCLDLSLPWPCIVWTATLGGSAEDVAFDVDTDPVGHATVTGYTGSLDFPVQMAWQPTYGGGQYDAFLLQLDPTGALVHSSYYGGNGTDLGFRVVVDRNLQATFGGISWSTNLTTVCPLQAANAGLSDAFVARVPWPGGAPVFATYHGGSSFEGFLYSSFPMYPTEVREFGLDVDDSGRVLFAGKTWSSNYPVTAGAFQPFLWGNGDGYATILDPCGATPRPWSTYLGHSASDGCVDAAFGPGNLAVLGGYTYSSGFPVTAGCFQPIWIGQPPTTTTAWNDAFLTWLDTSGVGTGQLRYSTFLGSAGWDAVCALEVDGRGHATAAGFCSPGFPGGAGWPGDAGGCQLTFGGGQDAWLARLRPLGTGRWDLTFGSYVGDSQNDYVFDLDLDRNGGAIVAGMTNSGVGLLGTYGGGWDGAAGHLDLLPCSASRSAASSVAHCSGTVFLELDRQYAAGSPFQILVGGAPPASFGVVVFSAAAQNPPLPFWGGALLGCALPVFHAGLAMSTPLGAHALPLPMPPGMPVPMGLQAQALWLVPGPCQIALASSATVGL